MNILIVKLSAIGDVVQTLPSLDALRRHYPKACITWVVEEAAADILDGHPSIDRLLVSRRKQWIENLRHARDMRSTFSEIKHFISLLRDRSYDIAIDFHGLFKSACIIAMSGARRKIGYNSLQELSGLFYSEKIFENMDKHAVERYLDFARHLGADPGEPTFLIPTSDEITARTDRILAQRGIGQETPFVAVSPVAFWETKLWNEGKFALLCDRIVRELGWAVIFSGRGRIDIINRIQERMTCPYINLTGETTLRELAAIFRRAVAVVTTDSGPMHIAAAMKTPTVALFGPTNPGRTGPYGKGHAVLRKEMSCSPCLKKHCTTRICMESIDVDEVFEALTCVARPVEGSYGRCRHDDRQQ